MDQILLTRTATRSSKRSARACGRSVTGRPNIFVWVSRVGRVAAKTSSMGGRRPKDAARGPWRRPACWTMLQVQRDGHDRPRGPPSRGRPLPQQGRGVRMSAPRPGNPHHEEVTPCSI